MEILNARQRMKQKKEAINVKNDLFLTRLDEALLEKLVKWKKTKE